jgi:DnaJ-class molecular chaperone
MTSMTDHWDVIEGVLEDERDRHIISGGLAANRKEIDAALAFVREQRAQVQQSAMKQYLKGRTTIIATRDEWNQRYVDGWKDGYNVLQEDSPQICAVCGGDGEIEDGSHLSPPIDGDWPMITCRECNGTGLEQRPQPKEGAA